MQRITADLVPFMLSFHTSARAFLRSSITQGIAECTDHTLVLNYADYLQGCSSTDIYYSCLPGHTPRDFTKALCFVENMICGSFAASSYPAFLKTLRLFGVEVAALAGYLRYLEKDIVSSAGHYRIIPTFPKDLSECLSAHKLVLLEEHTQTAEPTTSDWLKVVGWAAMTYPFLGDLDWFHYVGPQCYTSDDYSAYIFDLLKTISKPELKSFLLYREIVV